MNKILIVDDDTTIQSLLTELLTNEGYSVYNSYSGTETILLLEKENYELILLDLMLPGINGEDIIKRVHNTPIIVMSAKVQLKDRVDCLISGANDYITKPFDINELLARICVQLRINSNRNINNELRYKELRLILNDHSSYINENKIKFTKTEYSIIKQLMNNPRNVITKTKLLELISFDTEDCDENSLKVHISNIRKKIKKYTKTEYIESVWGIGFKMKD